MNNEINKEVMPKKKVDYLLRAFVTAIIIGVFTVIAFMVALNALGDTKATVEQFINTHGANHEFTPMMINMHNIAFGEVVFLGGLVLVVLITVALIARVRRNAVDKVKKVKIIRILAFLNAAVFVSYLIYAIIGLGTINGYLETVDADKLDLTQNYTSFVFDIVLYSFLVYEVNRAYKDTLSEPLIIDAF